MARLLLSLTLCLAATVASVARAHGKNDAMSHVFVAEAIPSTDVVMVATTTEGPYYESESDYINSTDMTAAGKAGSAGVTTNRASVLNGIPLTLTLGLYSVAGTTATELVGADVFLWHCDAAGVYSAVSVSEQRAEGTLGQKWLRGVQTTPANGSVSFRTILPGWYTGRTVHYHLRVRLAGSTSWAVTTQFFVSDAAVNSYKTLAPYVSNTGTITTLASDGIYNGIASTVASKLVLNLVGSNTAGYTASMNVGIATSVSAVTTTTTTSSGVAQPPSTTSAATAGTTASPLAVTAASSSSAVSALSLPATTAVTAVLLVIIAALW